MNQGQLALDSRELTFKLFQTPPQFPTPDARGLSLPGLGGLLSGLHVEDVDGVGRPRAQPIEALEVVDEVDGAALQSHELRHWRLEALL